MKIERKRGRRWEIDFVCEGMTSRFTSREIEGEARRIKMARHELDMVIDALMILRSELPRMDP